MMKRILWAAAAILALALVLEWEASVFPLSAQEYCQQQRQTGQKYCSGYEIAPFFIYWIGWAVLHGHGAITALATLIIGLFTWQLFNATGELRRSTDNLWKAGERHSERELRAYVGIDSIELDCPSLMFPEETYTPQPTNPGVVYANFSRIKIRNFGQTPAYKTEVWAGWAGARPFPANLSQDFKFEVRADTGVTVSNQILHQKQMHVAKIAIPDIRFLYRAEAQTESIFLYGYIDYEDGFKRRWRTHFCYGYEPWQPKGHRFVPHERNNYEEQISQ